MTLQARFADLVSRWVNAFARSRARKDPALSAELEAEAIRLGNAGEDPEAAYRILTPERLAPLVPDATAARVEALADTLARDAEAVCAALVPEENRAAVLAELEADEWPILVSPSGPHRWFADLWPWGIPGIRRAAWTIHPHREIAKLRPDAPMPPDRNAFRYGDGRAWPPTGDGPDYEASPATLPPESTRPWLSRAGAVLVTDAYWRVRPELGALWTLGLLAGGDLAREEHGAAARWALQQACEEEDADTIKALAGEVHKYAGGLWRALTKYAAEDDAKLADTSAGLLRADELAAAFLARIGNDGRFAADAIRSAARERCAARQGGAALALWRLWRPEQGGQPCARLLWAERLPGTAPGERPAPLAYDHEGAPPVLRNLALVLWHDVVKPRLDEQRALTKPGGFPVSSGAPSRAVLRMLGDGRGYGKGEGKTRPGHPWTTVTQKATREGAELRLEWEGRKKGPPAQLVFDLPGMGISPSAIATSILAELGEDGLMDWLVFHRLAAEQGRTGQFVWTWEEHRKGTRYEDEIRKGTRTEDELRRGVTNRLARLRQASLWLRQEDGDGATWKRVGPFGLVDVPAFRTEDHDRLVVACEVRINPELYAGAEAGAEHRNFFEMPESILRLPKRDLGLAVTLASQLARGGAGRTLEAGTLWAWARVREGDRTKKARWGDAAKTLENALERQRRHGILAGFERLDDGPMGPATRYRLRKGEGLAVAPRGQVPTAAGLPRTGAELTAWRTHLGLTQRALAVCSGIGQATISRAEGAPEEPLRARIIDALRALPR